MPTAILRLDDLHAEVTPVSPLGPIPHPFTATPSATPCVRAREGEPLLRPGDRVRNEGPTLTRPLAGTAFANPASVTGQGRFTDAGQQVLRVDGRPVATLAGRLETCSALVRETATAAAATLSAPPVPLVDGAPVLPGRNSGHPSDALSPDDSPLRPHPVPRDAAVGRARPGRPADPGPRRAGDLPLHRRTSAGPDGQEGDGDLARDGRPRRHPAVAGVGPG